MPDWAPRRPLWQSADLDEDDAGEDSFTLEGSDRPFDRRLTARQKVVRGGLACVAIVVTAFFVMGGPTAAVAFVQTLFPQRIATLYAAHRLDSPLTVLPAPAARQTSPDLRISPAAGNRGDAYACWADDGGSSKDGTPADGALHTAVLSDIKAAWTVLKPPDATAMRCSLAADTLRETWVALTVYTSASSNACALPDLFLSEDSAGTWVHVPWPNRWISACNIRLALTDGRLYVTADDPLLIRNGFEIGAPERIMSTGDEGKTWQVADVGLPFGSSVDLVALRPGGRLLVVTTDTSPAATGTLWESDTGGAAWQALGQLPGAEPVVEVSSNPDVTANGGWGRLYVVAETLTDGVPDGLNSPLVATGFPGGPWTTLKLPAPTASNDDAFVNEIEGAVVGPDDTLALLRVAPSAGLNTVAPANFVWVWSPARRSWQEASFVIPSNTVVQGSASNSSETRMWMTQFNLGVPISVNIRVFTITANGAK